MFPKCYAKVTQLTILNYKLLISLVFFLWATTEWE